MCYTIYVYIYIYIYIYEASICTFSAANPAVRRKLSATALGRRPVNAQITYRYDILVDSGEILGKSGEVLVKF